MEERHLKHPLRRYVVASIDMWLLAMLMFARRHLVHEHLYQLAWPYANELVCCRDRHVLYVQPVYMCIYRYTHMHRWCLGDFCIWT